MAKSATSVPEVPEVFVLSQGCTTTFPDLGLELPAGIPVPIPEPLLARVLTQPSVVQVHPEKEA